MIFGVSPVRPLTWVSGHVVYATSFSDPWAVFRLPTQSYDGRVRDAKETLIADLRDLAHHVGHDFSLLRVSSFWDRASYLRDIARRRSPYPKLRDLYLAEQAEMLPELTLGEPHVYQAISLRPPKRSVKEQATDNPINQIRSLVSRSLDATRLLPQDQAERDQHQAAQLLGRLLPYLPGIRPATTAELQWLIRRAWQRGVGEPRIDDLDQPAALIAERNGKAVLTPREYDLLHWTGAVKKEPYSLRVVGADQESCQIALALTRLPIADEAPSDLLEIAFRPTSRLAFPVDLSLCCEWVSNKRALDSIESTITRVDEDAISEDRSKRGATDEAAERPELARDKRTYLRRTRAPELHATLTAIVAGETAEQARERAKLTRQVFADNDCAVEKPPAQQLEAFFEHLPAQRSRLLGYTRQMTCEQFGAQGWTASHAVGSGRGWMLGRTLNAAATPVRFDPREGSRTNVAAGIALFGDLGAGKTTIAQKLCYEAVLDGARVIDEDPKGDHRWIDLLPEEAVEQITLDPSPNLRGLLDPWINAPRELRTNAAQSFLQALFPRGAQPGWETSLLRAIHAVAEREPRPSNAAVLRALKADGDPVASEVADHLAIHASTGLAQLGFADTDEAPVELGQRQVTSIVTARLPLPDATRKRSEYTPAEVLGDQLSALLWLLAMRLMAEDRARLLVYSSDEAWRRLKTQQGRDALDVQQRLSRSELVVPIVSTQLASDVGVDRDSIANLFGARFVGRSRDRDEVRRALSFCALDPDDELMVKRVMELRPGEALLQDHSGRAEFVSIDRTPSFAEASSTTPDTDAEEPSDSSGTTRAGDRS